MTGHSFVPLPGSERGSLPESQELGAVDESQEIEVTLVTRRRAALPRDLVEGPGTLTPQQFAEQHGTDPADLSLVTSVLAGHGLRVTERRRRRPPGHGAGHGRGAVRDVRGPAAPGPLAGPWSPGRPRSSTATAKEACRLPAELDGIVLAVLGLDNRPQARAHFRRAPAATARAGAPAAPGGAAAAPAAASTSYTPPQVAAAVPVPGGHGRDRPDHRDHRARRRVRQQRPRSLLRRAGRPGPLGHRGQRGRRGQPARPGSERGGRRGPAGHRGRWRGRPGGGAGRLLRAQHRPGFRGRGDHRGARHAHAHRGQHQLGPVGGLLDRPGPDRPGPGHGRRGRAGCHGLRRGRRQRQRATGRAASTWTSPRPARTRWPAAGPACTATPRPA